MRQVNEPLTAKVAGAVRRRSAACPASRCRRRARRTTRIWTFQLRDGVFFQDDETPFNAAAVQANATRWLTTAAGRALLPDLISVDAPSPGEVRFVLGRARPRISRSASRRHSSASSRPTRSRRPLATARSSRRPSQTGTGAFELRERDGDRALLARNTSWWGSSAKVELGPALDQIELQVTPESSLRLAMLDAGEAQLADELEPRAGRSGPRRSASERAAERRAGRSSALERSVRGVDSGREIPALSGAWLTGLARRSDQSPGPTSGGA